MRTPKALFVGLCSNDYLYYIDEFPKENTKVKTAMFDKYIGGPAANAAITYALLGGDATLATCLGKSDEADTIIENLNAFGVKVLNFSTDETLPNTSNIIISRDGRRTIFSGQQHFKNIQKQDISAYDFYLFDCNQQEIALDILKQIDSTKQIILDAGSWKDNIELFLKRADIVISSEVFLNPQKQNLLDMPECPAKEKVITRGEKPVLYHNEEFSIPKVDVVDTLGAGDIFHGAFCYSYFALGHSIKDALLYAINIASESVKHKGPRNFLLSIPQNISR